MAMCGAAVLERRVFSRGAGGLRDPFPVDRQKAGARPHGARGGYTFISTDFSSV
ncbi:hypothetical protein FEQ05_00738 [Burkholderia pseudomultivorans]|uniref:Uncharacterized protein n=1 Tax=Burkholderia pseudomultivorans TaxID=1207504 RepID=A0ABU2E166_9BURK|nr:hypothetical protein [Burkholderia pseudomultivorans]MDR8734324.1 hypothetical protein [Burkholderia pseudomultivorans]MDR8742294.1 hypothetical protein [Burkholderia pseudomultivorans]MDR8753607.1 hypothetical protein [Burkholderia pseudomultivorans]MDR8775708.1 hypothetical protein [Burkholderia pseudomultivorans]